MNPRLTTIFVAGLTLCTFIYIQSYSPISLRTTPVPLNANGQSAFSDLPLSQSKGVSQEESLPVKKDEGGKGTAKEYLQAAFQTSEKLYQAYLEKRRILVGDHPERVDPWPPAAVLYFWDYLLPTFSCPYSTQRIGTFGDGGKWVCGFELYEKNASEIETEASIPTHSRHCIVYSIGVAYESSFEAEFLERTDCEIFAYDGSVNRMGSQVAKSETRVHFNKLFINDSISTGLTLGQLMKKNNHKWIDFLKMDVEGAEIKVLNQVMDDFEILPFAHLNLEVHGDQEGKLFPEVYKLWERLEEKGLRPFKSEQNHWPCVRAQLRPIYAEYSFINIFGVSRLLP